MVAKNKFSLKMTAIGVPLAITNILLLLLVKTMDDDWLETSPTSPNSPGANYRARPNLFLQSAQSPSVIEHIIPGGKRTQAMAFLAYTSRWLPFLDILDGV
jgi:hypothetical protein